MEIINTFINEYGITIIYAILTTIAGAVGAWIGSVYKKYINDKTKQNVVKTCVKAVEQIYSNLHGAEKYDKAVESITQMLTEKSITITELEAKMLIESTCGEFIKSYKTELSKSIE